MDRQDGCGQDQEGLRRGLPLFFPPFINASITLVFRSRLLHACSSRQQRQAGNWGCVLIQNLSPPSSRYSPNNTKPNKVV